MSTTNYTKQSILVNCYRSVLDTLPENVILYENSPLLKWEKITFILRQTLWAS